MNVGPEKLFEKILSHDNVFYVHQQFTDPDLTREDRLKILLDLFQNNQRLFLQRYEQYIEPADCSIFENLRVDQDVALILNRVERKKEKNPKIEIRNRRYIALQKLKNTEYFTDKKMREREPYLYDVMIGRFLDKTESLKLRPTVDCSTRSGWSGLLSEFEMEEEIAQRRNAQKVYYEGKDDDDSEKYKRFFAHVQNAMENEQENEPMENVSELKEEIERISQEEAQAMGTGGEERPDVLRDEFTSYMYERFLDGKDSPFFDYSTVDGAENDAYDDIKTRDEEEEWFNDD